jgi:hypothetical protein
VFWASGLILDAAGDRGFSGLRNLKHDSEDYPPFGSKRPRSFQGSRARMAFSPTMATAILIDGDFFLRCNHAIYYIDVTVREATSAKSSNPFWIFQRPNTTYDS